MSASAFSFSTLSPSHLPLPAFHSTDLIPALLIVYGLAVAFLGVRISRFFCFTVGFVLGAYYVDELFITETAIRHAGLPLIVITLVSLVAAVTALLLHELLLSVMLGYLLADFVIAADNGRVLGWGIGRWIAIGAVCTAVLLAGRKNWVSARTSITDLHCLPHDATLTPRLSLCASSLSRRRC